MPGGEKKVITWSNTKLQLFSFLNRTIVEIFLTFFTLTIAVLRYFKRKKIETFEGLCTLIAISGLTALPRPPAVILRAFGTSVFCFAKNRSAHIFSVLSPN